MTNSRKDTNCTGFEIVATEGGFQIVDTDRGNNWGRMATVFRTDDLALDYAFACAAFKTGRSMTVRPCPTGF